MSSEDDVRTLVTTIRAYGSSLNSLREPLQVALERHGQSDSRKFSADYWATVAYHDSVVRVQILTEQNFVFIESLGLLVTTRYLFEVLVWLRLIRQERGYALAYYSELLETQRRFYVDLSEHLRREVAALRKIDEIEQNRLKSVGTTTRSPEALAAEISRIQSEIDAGAARKFTIYGDQAKVNGYGLQAYLVETKALPSAEDAARVVEFERGELLKSLSLTTKRLVPRKWEWRKQANAVGMLSDYDFIYTYTSKLVHATPPSITTDQKNLEVAEVILFLKYCRVSLADVIDLTQEFLAQVRPN